MLRLFALEQIKWKLFTYALDFKLHQMIAVVTNCLPATKREKKRKLLVKMYFVVKIKWSIYFVVVAAAKKRRSNVRGSVHRTHTAVKEDVLHSIKEWRKGCEISRFFCFICFLSMRNFPGTRKRERGRDRGSKWYDRISKWERHKVSFY